MFKIKFKYFTDCFKKRTYAQTICCCAVGSPGKCSKWVDSLVQTSKRHFSKFSKVQFSGTRKRPWANWAACALPQILKIRSVCPTTVYHSLPQCVLPHSTIVCPTTMCPTTTVCPTTDLEDSISVLAEPQKNTLEPFQPHTQRSSRLGCHHHHPYHYHYNGFVSIITPRNVLHYSF